MKPKEIRDLIDFISSSGLDEVNIETPEFKLSVKKNSAPTIAPVMEIPVTSNATAAQAAATEQQAVAVHSTAPVASTSNLIEIKSPMIGTFYLSSGPTAEPFVQEGDKVKAGQTVCIIEAMKLFNEIESEYSGSIVKVLVENASPVEYDQPLFLVDPS